MQVCHFSILFASFCALYVVSLCTERSRILRTLFLKVRPICFRKLLDVIPLLHPKKVQVFWSPASASEIYGMKLSHLLFFLLSTAAISSFCNLMQGHGSNRTTQAFHFKSERVNYPCSDQKWI